jgi:hypothetical protein
MNLLVYYVCHFPALGTKPLVDHIFYKPSSNVAPRKVAAMGVRGPLEASRSRSRIKIRSSMGNINTVLSDHNEVYAIFLVAPRAAQAHLGSAPQDRW